ncbi:MAG: type I polyketide synthase [Cyanobacteriota bacterium]|nr:type I polyketide synthase [Cyanobacteriota bacterium]
MNPAIAIVGLACEYPDARSPLELWENALAQRQAFRQLPPERLNLNDYFSSDRAAPDRTYASHAALIEGYNFDRVGFRVPSTTFNSADLAHWLALDIAARALTDAGFPNAEGLPRDRTGVLLGNTLTGEFSRANVLRLRWPYVRRLVEKVSIEQNWDLQQRQRFLEQLEAQYKQPFPEVAEETLAGGLSNTIAGRICNHFNLNGGGYTLDGACSSSLLAVANACTALTMGDLEVALAGGIDLSLDPFELVGFAKTGALAPEKMRIYDRDSAGFLPGEGCGFVVLMRYEDAIAQFRHIYAVLRGWGISSDGSGGITRPEVAGQQLALERAYGRAGFGPQTIAYFEGHGTGTHVGDTTELRALARTIQKSQTNGETLAQPAAIGSIKANIGHTKAAAGVAGLIKATMAVYSQTLPPTTGCENPHAEFSGKTPALRVLDRAEPWPKNAPRRAGVSAMGFGGINAHLVLEEIGSTAGIQSLSPQPEEYTTNREMGRQDSELFLMGATTLETLEAQIDRCLAIAPQLSYAEVTDLAVQLAKTLEHQPIRAAIVAANPPELVTGLETLKSWLSQGISHRLDSQKGVFLGTEVAPPRIGFLFPGQAAPTYVNGGAWSQRFPNLRDLYDRADLPIGDNPQNTAIAQPAILTAALAGLQTLNHFGIKGAIAVGHSLGELAALHWGGAFDADTLLRIAKVRGKAMASLGHNSGKMASILADRATATSLLHGARVAIAGFNSPRQTVISGEADAIATALERARQQGLKAIPLPVSSAFHSPLVAPAIGPLANYLARLSLQPLQRPIVSTITGTTLAEGEDLRSLLCTQITAPVRFIEAATQADSQVDLWLEVGPGRVLSGLMGDFVKTPVIPLDAGGSSLKGLLRAIGAAWTLGAPINAEPLFVGRFARPFNLDWQPQFFVNPCERFRSSEFRVQSSELRVENSELRIQESEVGNFSETSVGAGSPRPEKVSPRPYSIQETRKHSTDSADTIVRQLVAERTDLPLSAIADDSRMLNDLHLNSISASQIVTEAARRQGLSPPTTPTDYANATIAEVVRALEELALNGNSSAEEQPQHLPAGVDTWVKSFILQRVERPLIPNPENLATARSPGQSSVANLKVNDRTPPGQWRVFAPNDHPLALSLEQAFNEWGGDGILVCLPPEPDERHLNLLLRSAKAALEQKSTHFVLVQHGGGGGGFVRTLHQEIPHLNTCIVDLPFDCLHLGDRVLAEAKSARGFVEVQYDAAGCRYESVLRLLPSESSRAAICKFNAEDLLLVTGGGKGIAAESALSLARETGIRLALLGRSQPESDAELAANLERMTASDVQFRYLACDVTDGAAVRHAIAQLEAEFGPVTAILHGAGRNVPQLLNSLDEGDIHRTLAPKLQGLRNILAAIDPHQLKLLLAFGSIIARTGLRGEADYALANEWLASFVQRFGQNYPDCRCLTVEWSIWSGMGMGERLGRVEMLRQQGITPIPPDAGVAVLHRLIARASVKDRQLPGSVVVSGRLGNLPTLKWEHKELPFLRFLEHPRICIPGVELVVDVELSAVTDPYVEDHCFEGDRLFPAVMGFEAMAQVAMALAETELLPVFEEVKLNRPIVVPKDATVTLRIAALMGAGDRVEVVIRTEETAFGVNHFEAVCRFNVVFDLSPKLPTAIASSALPLDPQRDLYGNILFHQGRFQRLRSYRHLAATECCAEIESNSQQDWFGRYLPATLRLPDPGARDAVIHAIQGCIPHGTLLPVAVERIVLGAMPSEETWWVRAVERVQQGDTFIYDVEVMGAEGQPLERWEGLQLRRVRSVLPQVWATPLLAPYLQRRANEWVPGSKLRVAVVEDGSLERRERGDRAIQCLLGPTATVSRRGDGKPEVVGGSAISLAHTDKITLAIAGFEPLGCDVEPVTSRSADLWRDLLGSQRFALTGVIARDAEEDLDSAATRVWTAIECLKKAGAFANAPLTLLSATTDGWVILTAGSWAILTFIPSSTRDRQRFVFAILTQDLRSHVL